nr:unnamed protein product [Haemonchus contortus]
MATMTINLQTDLSHLHEATPEILEALTKIGPQNIGEVKFVVGRSMQGCYLRLDFLPFPVPLPVVDSSPRPKKYEEIGVSCCGDFPNLDFGALITSGIIYEVNGNKCDTSIQTGKPHVSK